MADNNLRHSHYNKMVAEKKITLNQKVQVVSGNKNINAVVRHKMDDNGLWWAVQVLERTDKYPSKKKLYGVSVTEII